MPRKTIQHAAIPSSSRSAPSLSRNSPSSSSESTSRLNLHTLVEPGSGKTPNINRQQSRQQQECGTGSGMGKGGRVNGASGGTEGQADEGSECEGEAEDDDDDDDEADDPAVSCPVKGKDQVPLQDSQIEYMNGDQGGNPTNSNHLTGQRKRSIHDVTNANDGHLAPAGPNASNALQEDDEPDYPRKRMAKTIATTTEGILMYAGSRESDFEDYEGQTDTDDQADISDDDEEDIENEEEEAIIREFEKEDEIQNTSSDLLLKDGSTIDVLDTGLGETMEDLDNELFDTQWNEPHRFDDMHWGHGPKPDLFSSNFSWEPELFSNPSNQDTPDITPRQSFSVPITQNHAQKVSDEEDSKSSEDESSIDTFFFDRFTPLTQQLVSTNGRGWKDETDDDVDLLQYFFSSNSSGEGESADDSDDEGSSGDESEGDGETTDEDEDLPTPLPRKKSVLQDSSYSPALFNPPQIVHLDNNNASPPKGPKLCSWIADPSRPICVVENWKTTILLPETDNRFSISGASEGYSSNTVGPLYESESEQSSVQAVFDPTLSGLLEVEGGVLNGSDVLGPPEAFFPYTDITQESNFLAEGSTEEDLLDEGEAQLKIGDFLCLSGEEEDDEEDITGLMTMSEDSMDEDVDEEISPKTDTPEKMLSRFRKVSVTAFRKRQVQHNPKNQKWHQSHSGKGDSRLMDTLVAPAKARKIRGRFLNSRGGFNAAVTPKRKTNSKWG